MKKGILDIFSRSYKVYIQGITGRMGSMLKSHIEKNVEKDSSIPEFILVNNRQDLEIIKSADLILDFSHHEAIENFFELKDKAILVGTTGAPEQDLYLKKLNEIARNNAVFYSATLSPSIYLIRDFLNQLQSHNMMSSFILDIHHKHKKDAPSGTAKFLGSSLLGVDYGSIRSGDEIGEHLIRVNLGNESIEINHKIKSREMFAINALKIGSWLAKQQKGFYTMGDYVDCINSPLSNREKL